MLRTRLLEIAIDHFGRNGFDGASTRDIARDSGVAMSSITYHFGGKRGLYLATADHIATGVLARIGPVLDEVDTAGNLDRTHATALLLTVLDDIATMMMHPETEPWSRFIIREQQAPTEAFERLYEGAMRRVADTLVRLVAIARPELNDRNARATAVMLFGQALILRAGRTTVCRVLRVTEFDDAVQTSLRDCLRANVLRVL